MMIPNVCVVVEVNGVNGLVFGCNDSGSMLFFIDHLGIEAGGL